MKLPAFACCIILGCLCVSAIVAQTASPNLPIDPETKKLTYRDVVNQEGNPGYLYDKAIQWFGYYYLNAASVFSVQDRVNGKVEGVGRLRIYNNDSKTGLHTEGGLVTYQIKIEFKENRYRYTLTDFNLKLASRFPIEKWMNREDPAYNPSWDTYLYQVDTTMQRLVSTLKEKMKPIVVKKDEW
ncbi:MAG: DUF4468 domain-containing protein [Bacteroidetes bacterium]|nr:DUF4468 domain-containing protein [Bacteroidota bacterium]